MLLVHDAACSLTRFEFGATRNSPATKRNCMDRDSHKRRIERSSRNARIFPGGEYETRNCTGCAQIIADRFGGEVRGYYHAHNSTARVGESEGGHDFAITTDRFLVDPWLYHYYGELPVLDLDVAADRAQASARYGPEENWQRVPNLPRAMPGQASKAGSLLTARAG
jgi:hypothetical protein